MRLIDPLGLKKSPHSSQPNQVTIPLPATLGFDLIVIEAPRQRAARDPNLRQRLRGHHHDDRCGAPTGARRHQPLQRHELARDHGTPRACSDSGSAARRMPNNFLGMLQGAHRRGAAAEHCVAAPDDGPARPAGGRFQRATPGRGSSPGGGRAGGHLRQPGGSAAPVGSAAARPRRSALRRRTDGSPTTSREWPSACAASIVERAVELANNNWTLPAEPTQLAIGAAATANPRGTFAGAVLQTVAPDRRDPRAELARQPGPDLRPDPQLGHHERRPQAPRPLRRASRSFQGLQSNWRPATSRPTTPWWSGSPVRSSARSVPRTSAAATSSGRWTRRSPRPGASSTSRAHCSGPRRRITRTTPAPSSYARDLVAQLHRSDDRRARGCMSWSARRKYPDFAPGYQPLSAFMAGRTVTTCLTATSASPSSERSCLPPRSTDGQNLRGVRRFPNA